jgi:hypothetical protein
MPDDPGSRRDTFAGSPASIGLLEQVPAPELGWSVRITVAHADGPVTAWATTLFDSPDAIEAWLADRRRHTLRPAVRSCADVPGDLGYAAVLDDEGAELVVSTPVRRIKAAGIAALLAAELRART